MRCDAYLRCGFLEALWWLPNAVVRMNSSTVWTELDLFEYMSDIHMSEVASLIVKKNNRFNYCIAKIRNNSFQFKTSMFKQKQRSQWEARPMWVLTPQLENNEVWRKFEMWLLWRSVIAAKRHCPFFSIECLDWAMAVWIYGQYSNVHMSEVASLIVKKV